MFGLMGIKKRLIEKCKDQHLSEVLEKGFVAFSMRIVGAGLSFLFTFYLARSINASDFGLFTLSLTIITIISVIVRFGLDNVLIRYISIANENNDISMIRGYFAKIFSFVLAVGTVLTIIVLLISGVISSNVFNKPELGMPLEIMTLLLLPLSFMYLLSEALRGLKKIQDSTISQNIILPGLSLVILIVGTKLTIMNLDGIIVLYIFSASIAALYAWIRWRVYVKPGARAKVKIMEILKKGFPLLLASSGALIMSWSDVIVLGIYSRTSDVAIYAVSMKIALLISLVLYAVNSISAPKFAAFYSKKAIKSMELLSKQSTLIMLSIATPLALLIIIGSSFILELFGEEYLAGSMVLVILVIGQFVNVFFGSVGYLLIMSDHEKIYRNILLSTAIMNILLNIIFVQLYGINGVALATTISITMWNIWMLLSVKKHLGFWSISLPNLYKSQ